MHALRSGRLDVTVQILVLKEVLVPQFFHHHHYPRDEMKIVKSFCQGIEIPGGEAQLLHHFYNYGKSTAPRDGGDGSIFDKCC